MADALASPLSPRSGPRVVHNQLYASQAEDDSPLRAVSPERERNERAAYTQRGGFVRSEAVTTALRSRDVVGDGALGADILVDDALVNSSRAREENVRCMAEVLAGIERSFAPNDDKRLVCRAFIVQFGRSGGRLREATCRLEREAADALRIANHDRAALRSRLRHFQLQAAGQQKLLDGEVQRSEAERMMQGEQLRGEMERQRREREEEVNRLDSESARLRASLDASRAETAALLSQSQNQQQILSSEISALREQVARLTAELAASRDQHGMDAATLRSELTLMAAEKTSSVSRLRSDLAYMTELASETESRLEASLVMLKVEKEAAIDHMRAEAAAMAERHEAQIAELSAQLKHSQLASESTERELRGIIRSERQAHEDATATLRSRVSRLTSVHKAALDAGTIRGRQILYNESIRNDAKGASGSLTWRGAAEPSDDVAVSISDLHHGPVEELVDAPATPPSPRGGGGRRGGGGSGGGAGGGAGPESPF